jgi:hypothetical protein
MLLATLSIYGGPLTIIFIVYAYILRYIRQTLNIQRKRQKANKRDVIILRRIAILLVCLVMIGVPTLSVLMFYIITDYLTPLNYDIQSLNISIGLVVTPVTMVFFTPEIRHLFQQKRQHMFHMITRRNIQQTMTSSTASRPLSEN